MLKNVLFPLLLLVSILAGIAGILDWVPLRALFPSASSTPREQLFSNRPSVQLKPVENAGEQRFSDIASNYFSTSYEKSFTYDVPAYAKLTFERKSSTFKGEIAVSGLKPNFAYQMKLVGTPEHKKTMEKIGFRGRWLLSGGGTNFSDDDYRKLKDKSQAESYIFFDWFVTDSNGAAKKTFSLDSCYHVLMSKTLENSIPPDDSLLKKFEIALFHPPAYDKRYDPSEVEIWAMSENHWSKQRPKVGELKLMQGQYTCLFRLTEECFHGYGGGHWATALQAEISFEIDQSFFR